MATADGTLTFDRALGAWHATGYATVSAVLHDARWRRPDPAAAPLPTAWNAPGGGTWPRSLLQAEAAADDRLQRRVAQELTSARLSGLAAHVKEGAHRLLDQAQDGQIDLVGGFALPLLTDACAGLLGLAPEEQPPLTSCLRALAQAPAPAPTPAVRMQAAAAAATLAATCSDLLSRRRRHPGPDLLSALLAADDERDRLTHPELLEVCTALLAACCEVGIQLIAAGAWLLWQHPEQLAQAMQMPALWPGAVGELLRYLSPVRGIPCVAGEALTLGGQRIGAGELVLADILSANHDSAVFDTPQRLDIRRPHNPHLALGGGRWWQPGAPLVRHTAELALAVLAQRLPALGPEQAPPGSGRGGIIRPFWSAPVRL